MYTPKVCSTTSKPRYSSSITSPWLWLGCTPAFLNVLLLVLLQSEEVSSRHALHLNHGDDETIASYMVHFAFHKLS